MFKRLLKSLRKDVTEDDYVQIKSIVVENFMIQDLQAQVAYEREMKEGLEVRIEELKKQLNNALQEMEEYRGKYCKADVDNLNLVVAKSKLQSEYNNLLYRLQKYEGSPQEE